jgi:hypothetical protein
MHISHASIEPTLRDGLPKKYDCEKLHFYLYGEKGTMSGHVSYEYAMGEAEHKALLVDLTFYRGVLSSTLNPVRRGACNFIIRRLEAKLIDAGFPVLLETDRPLHGRS